MNSQRFRLILLGVLALCIVLFFALCFFGLSILSEKSQKMVDLKLQNKTAEAQLNNLERSKKDVEKYSYFKSVAKSVIPNDKNQAQAVLEIFQIANAAGIAIQSITFPSSNLGAKSATIPANPSTPPTKDVLSQAQPVSGIPGLYSLQLTITPETGQQLPAAQQVTYDKMLNFLSRIENNRRTAQITQVNIQPLGGVGGGQLINFSLVVNIFIKP